MTSCTRYSEPCNYGSTGCLTICGPCCPGYTTAPQPVAEQVPGGCVKLSDKWGCSDFRKSRLSSCPSNCPGHTDDLFVRRLEDTMVDSAVPRFFELATGRKYRGDGNGDTCVNDIRALLMSFWNLRIDTVRRRLADRCPDAECDDCLANGRFRMHDGICGTSMMKCNRVLQPATEPEAETLDLDAIKSRHQAWGGHDDYDDLQALIAEVEKLHNRGTLRKQVGGFGEVTTWHFETGIWDVPAQYVSLGNYKHLHEEHRKLHEATERLMHLSDAAIERHKQLRQERDQAQAQTRAVQEILEHVRAEKEELGVRLDRCQTDAEERLGDAERRIESLETR